MDEQMRARDLMTTAVVTIPPETPVNSLAQLLAERGISAVPVIGAAGDLLGIVTEGDLVRRLAEQDEEPLGWFAGLFADPARQAERYARTHGLTARDVMTAEVVSVTPEAAATEIARLMQERGVRRVLVLEDGRLCGIVSRADLLRAVMTAPQVTQGSTSDEAIRRAVLAELRKQPWADTFHLMVEVRDGVVEFHGFRLHEHEATRRALRVLAENVPGVRGVTDNTLPTPAYTYTT